MFCALSRGLASLLLTLTLACSCVYICKFQFRPIHPPSRRLSGGVKRVINFDVLRQLLGDNAVEDAPEAYEFNWVGKQAARAEVLEPIMTSYPAGAVFSFK